MNRQGLCAPDRGGMASVMWYSFAMDRKVVAIFVLLLASTVRTSVAQSPANGAQAGSPAATRPSTTAPRPPLNRESSASQTSKNGSASGEESAGENGASDYPPAHMSVVTPVAEPSPWPWQDRIAWAANLVLVVLGYAGILLAISILKKIEGQMHFAETAAQAALESAQAALLHARANERAERPWLLVTVEPSRRAENRFIITATNRGRNPARILSSVDAITIEPDAASLPPEPKYDEAEPNPSLVSVILLPGESTAVKVFGRDDVKLVCGTGERYRKVERWEEVILLYGQILYEDVVARDDPPQRESAWCCSYIHGQQSSAMEMAGPPAYNRHT